MASVRKYAEHVFSSEVSLKDFTVVAVDSLRGPLFLTGTGMNDPEAPFGPHPSVKHAIWLRKFQSIWVFFGGGTSEEQEDKALNILLGAESADELLFLVRNLLWTNLDDELDENDIDSLAGTLSMLLDRSDSRLHRWLGRFVTADPWVVHEVDQATVLAEINATVPTYSGGVGIAFIDEMLSQEDILLDQVAVFALRNVRTHVLEFGWLLTALAGAVPDRAADLQRMGWRLFYTDGICVSIQRRAFDQLFPMLPDMVDPGIPLVQRTALFDMLRRWEDRFRAIEDTVNLLGTGEQQGAIARLRSAIQVFLSNFPTTTPAPGVIATIANAFGEAADSIEELRDEVANFAVAFVDMFAEWPSFLNDMTDDEAHFLINTLLGVKIHGGGVSLVAVIPTGLKLALIDRLIDGSTVDADEQAILTMLRESQHGVSTSRQAKAEFLQLIDGRYDRLDFSLDHTEHDQFEQLLADV